MRLPTIGLLIALTFTVPGFGAMLSGGQPAIQRFSPDLDVFPQNFQISVDSASRVYLGNSDGVLIFDGEYWQLVEVSNEDIVRSLAYDENGRMYVGGFDAFGFIEQDTNGQFAYRELSHLYANDIDSELFADIWHIQVTPDAVYFVALKHLFSYEPNTGETQFWKHNAGFGPIAYFHDKTLLQFRGEGIKYFMDGDWHLLEGPNLALAYLESMVTVGDNELILVSSDSNWYRYDGNQFTEIPEAYEIPHKGSVTSAIPLSNGTLALTTQLGRMVFYELETGRTDIVEVANGFLPSATTTTAGDILVVDDVGFHALQWPARWTAVDSKHGLAGSVNRIESVDGRTYVLSSSGAFVTEIGDAQFRQLAWTDYEAWDMLVLDDGNILFADSYQIKLISPEGQITIVDDRTTARLFLPSRFDKDIVYVGSEFGIQVLRRHNGAWRAIFKLEDMDNLTVTQIVEVTPSELWIGSTRGGIRRINIDDITSETADITMMTAADGIDYGSLPEGAYIYQIDGEMLASTSAGIFHWKGERFEPDSLNGLADLRTPGQTLEFAIKDNELWAYHFNRLFQFSGAWSEEDVSGLRIGAISSIDFVDNRVLVGGLGSILLLNPDAVTAPTPNAPLNLTAASLYKAVEGNLVVEPVSFDSITISSRDERLNLRFSLPDFRKPDDVRYRTRLSPAEANYSPWSETSQQSFVNLAPGEYSLQVLGRDSSGRVADLTIPITVMPQWFETTTLRALAFALIFILAYFSVIQLAKRRSRILALERDQLEEIVAERTRALQSANRQLDKMAHLDGLTQIPNRRRLESYLEDVRLQCVEHGRVMALAIIDVDRFKEFNDTFGHQAGDSLLIDLAKLLSRNLRRAEDLVARYGGEEFLVVLPGADPDTALRVIEEMREKVAASELNVTISAGLHVTLPLDDTQMSDLIKTADEALYRAKSEGRNRVMVG